MAETIHLPIGPQHPFLKEPAKFDFDIQGEEIVGARMNIGYNHRGLEKLCEERNYYQCIYILERICGICSHSHTTAFCQATEKLLGLELPKRGLYLRTLVCELERLHSHLLWLGVAAHEVGFDTPVHAGVARPRARHGRPRGDLRQPRQLRLQHHRRRAARPLRGAAQEDPRRCSSPCSQRTEFYAEHRHQRAVVSWPASAASASCQAARHRHVHRRAVCPRLRRRPRRPPRRALCRLPVPRVQGHHQRRVRHLRPGARARARDGRVLQDDQADARRTCPRATFVAPKVHAPRPGGRGHVVLRGAARRGHPLRARQRHREAGAGQGARPHDGQPRGGVRVGGRLVRGRHPDRHRLHRPVLLVHRPHQRGAQRPPPRPPRHHLG